MSILIKGMQMPESCIFCPCESYGECNANHCKNVEEACVKKERDKDCPLIPVPPHGRLIDADKIGLTDFEIILCQKGNPFKNALEMLLEKIENAPTVIPAEEGEK